jgi:hypothetical protein
MERSICFSRRENEEESSLDRESAGSVRLRRTDWRWKACKKIDEKLREESERERASSSKGGMKCCHKRERGERERAGLGEFSDEEEQEVETEDGEIGENVEREGLECEFKKKFSHIFSDVILLWICDAKLSV